jgi:hypothetical protein
MVYNTCFFGKQSIRLIRHHKYSQSLTLLGIWLSIFIVFFSCAAAADVPKSQQQSGSIELDFNNEKLDPYGITQEKTIIFLQNLRTHLESVASHQKKIILPEGETIHYLTGLYLFCTIKRGTCASVLEALYEIDLVNSRLSNTALCPVMKSFWKRYLENDFEERLKYNTSTGFVTKLNEFNAKERPRFVRCEESLKELFKTEQNAQSLFSSRYQSQSKPLRAIDDVLTLIRLLKEKQVNVFSATGAQ